VTSANVLQFTSVNPNQTLNGNATGDRRKTDNSQAALTFATMMSGNYSNRQVSSASTEHTEQTGHTESKSQGQEYKHYQYQDQDSRIASASNTTIADKISDSAEKLNDFAREAVQTVAKDLDVDETDVTEAMEVLGITAFDLLQPQELANLAAELTGESNKTELLTNAQFLDLMQEMNQMGVELTQSLGLDQQQMSELTELVAQMDPVDGSVDFAQMMGTEALESVKTQDIPMESTEPVVDQIAEPAVKAMVEPAVEATVESNREVPVRETVDSVTELQEDQSLSTSVAQQPDVGADNSKEESFAESQKENTESTTSTVASERTPDESQMHPSVSFELNDIPQEVETPVIEEPQNLTFDPMELIERLAEHTQISVSEGFSSMEMQLNPENLGKVYLQISSKEGVVNANIAASNEEVRMALEAQIADLRQSLNQAGVKVDAIEVTVASHEFEKNLEQNQNGDRQQGERQQEQAMQRRSIQLSSLDELSGVMTEEEALAAQIMRDNGNSVDLTA
jgi:flagellar hook-length control protein FliK